MSSTGTSTVETARRMDGIQGETTVEQKIISFTTVNKQTNVDSRRELKVEKVHARKS